jgi:phosphate transport system substrate-binding protein
MKVIAVSASITDPPSYIFPSAETVNDATYPIARDLFMYTAGPPEGFVKRYMEWIFSPEAQDTVTQLGFVPIIAQ